LAPSPNGGKARVSDRCGGSGLGARGPQAYPAHPGSECRATDNRRIGAEERAHRTDPPECRQFLAAP
jgi:hypothetical protein